MTLWGLLDMYYVCFYVFLFALCSLYCNYIWWEQMCRLIGVSSSPSSALAPLPASHPYYLSWQYNQCFLPMLLNVFLLALIASFSLHCNSKWVWQITTIYLPRYTGFLYPYPVHTTQWYIGAQLENKAKTQAMPHRLSLPKPSPHHTMKYWGPNRE